jgi:hypothetical protein
MEKHWNYIFSSGFFASISVGNWLLNNANEVISIGAGIIAIISGVYGLIGAHEKRKAQRLQITIEKMKVCHECRQTMMGDLCPYPKERPAGCPFKAVLALLALLLLAGCTSPEIIYKDFHYKRPRFGTRENVKLVEVVISTNGEVRFRLEGYASDQVEALGTIAREAAKGAVEGAK